MQLGKEAASEVRKQYPIIEDQHIAKYLTQIGNRLVAAAPTELKQSVYEYSFTPVNLKDINAFALPGGPMFVQRGMFDAAAEEAEVAGVMAHELSHGERVEGPEPVAAARPDRRRGRRRGRRRRAGRVHRGRHPVRSRHAAAPLQPRLREAGGPPRRADHGAGRLRPARARSCAESKRVNSAQQDRNLFQLALFRSTILRSRESDAEA